LLTVGLEGSNCVRWPVAPRAAICQLCEVYSHTLPSESCHVCPTVALAGNCPTEVACCKLASAGVVVDVGALVGVFEVSVSASCQVVGE
jgi:hypothetical protein